jgi:adenosylcobinamide-GDP ribazoletransferase
VRSALRSATAAVTFLTAAPLGRRIQVGEDDLRRGAVLFPVIGALVGAMAGLVSWGATFALPPLVAAVLGVAVGVLVTAALHVDGLADVADGIGAVLAGRDPSAAMRDPRLGTFGGAALTLDLILKTSVLTSLLAGPRFPLELLAAAALARVAPLVLGMALPYIGPASGSGRWTNRVGPGTLLAATAIASAVGVGSIGPAFLAMLAVGALVTALLGRWSAVHLGGVTGDVFGASAELTETLALTAALALR